MKENKCYRGERKKRWNEKLQHYWLMERKRKINYIEGNFRFPSFQILPILGGSQMWSRSNFASITLSLSS